MNQGSRENVNWRKYGSFKFELLLHPRLVDVCDMNAGCTSEFKRRPNWVLQGLYCVRGKSFVKHTYNHSLILSYSKSGQVRIYP